MKVKRQRLAFFLLTQVLLALLALAVEVVARITLPHVSLLEALVRSPEARASLVDRQQASIFEGDPWLFWRLQPDLRDAIWDFTPVSTNAQHLRYGAAVGRKPPGGLRIVCLGDSVTFGYRVPTVWPERPHDYMRDAKPYPVLLEEWLREANPGRSIEVIPLAVPGYSSYQGMVWARRDLARLQPDIVIACFGWNDANTSGEEDVKAMPADPPHLLLRQMMEWSQAITHVVLAVRRRRGGPGTVPAPVARVSRDQFVQNCLEVARLAGKLHAATLLVGTVYRDRTTNPPEAERIAAYRTALQQAAEVASVPYLRIPELTEANPGSSALFGELIHPNHLGHRLMAERLLAFMTHRRWLRDLSIPQIP